MSGLSTDFLDSDEDDSAPTVAQKYMIPTPEQSVPETQEAPMHPPNMDATETKQQEPPRMELTQTVQAITKNQTFVNLECGQMNSVWKVSVLPLRHDPRATTGLQRNNESSVDKQLDLLRWICWTPTFRES